MTRLAFVALVAAALSEVERAIPGAETSAVSRAKEAAAYAAAPGRAAGIWACVALAMPESDPARRPVCALAALLAAEYRAQNGPAKKSDDGP